MPPVTRLKVADLAPQLTCPLCKGYFIDATTITECLHSFCKTCIISYLKTNQFCPTCEVQIHKTKPLLSVKPDQTLQSIVYKLVPGLYHAEMRNRKQFLQLHPEIDTSTMDPESRGEMRGHHFIYAPEDPISLVLEFQSPSRPAGEPNSKEELVVPPRYLNCPAGVTISHLKKLTRMKFNLEPRYRVDILHRGECLPEDYTLIDVAYVFRWTRDKPLKFTYRIYEQVRKTRRIPRGMSRSADKEGAQCDITATGADRVDGVCGPEESNGGTDHSGGPVEGSPVTDGGSSLVVDESVSTDGGVPCSGPLPAEGKSCAPSGEAASENGDTKDTPDPFVGSPLLGLEAGGSSASVQKDTPGDSPACEPSVKQSAGPRKTLKRVGSPLNTDSDKVSKTARPDAPSDLDQVLPAVGLTPRVPGRPLGTAQKEKSSEEKPRKTLEPQFEALDLSNHKIRPRSTPLPGPPPVPLNTSVVINTPVSTVGSRSSGIKSPAKRGKGQATQTILSIAESLANKQLSNLMNKANGVSVPPSNLPPTINLMTLSQTAEKVRQLEMAMKPNSPLDGQTFPRGSSPPSPSMYGTTLASVPRLPSDTVLLPEKSRKNILKVPEVGKPPAPAASTPPQPCPGNPESMSILKSFITNRGMSALLKIPTVKPVTPKPARPVKRSSKGALKSPIETRMHELIKNQQLIKKQQSSGSPMAVPKFFQKSSSPQKPSFSVSIFRSPNPNVRQIPNPSLLRHQSQDRLPCPPPDKDSVRRDDPKSTDKFKLPVLGSPSPAQRL